MIEKINLLLQEIQNLTASSKEEVERLRIQYLSKKGILNDLFNDFKNVPNEEKRAVGQLLNELKNTAQEKINSLKETFENNDLGEQIDLSRSAADFNLGTRHPLSLVKVSADGETFAACYRNFKIAEFDTEDGQLIHRSISRL